MYGYQRFSLLGWVVALLALPLTLAAQFPNVQIGEGGKLGPSEPSIAINPTNPQNVVAGAILNRVYHSFDGGAHWNELTLKSKYGVYGDPCVIADEQGNFYYLHLSTPSGQGWGNEDFLDRIVCQRSEDGGKRWNSGSFMGFNHPRDQDKEWAVADPASGYLYASWTQFDKYNSTQPEDSTLILFARSRDRGTTWEQPVRLSQRAGDCLDSDGTVEGAVPAAGPEGQAYVAWSLDDAIWFDRSLDSGATWMEQDIKAVEGTKGWDIEVPGLSRCNGMPVTVCDLSTGPHRGTIYINWADQRNGTDNTDIWVTRSTDGGDTWSEPLRVNDDAGKAHQFFSWMAVDQTTGYLYVVFYDRRNHTGHETDVYLAYSTDGGASFTNVKISESPFVPDKSVFFGDYNNISVHGGVIRPIWTRYAGRKLSVWTALINEKTLLEQRKTD